MFYALMVLSLAVIMRQVERHPRQIVNRVISIVIWIFLSLLMRDSYHWQAQQPWSWYFVLLFILSGSALYYTTMIGILQWSFPWQKRLDRPLLRKILFYFLITLSLSTLVVSLTRMD